MLTPSPERILLDGGVLCGQPRLTPMISAVLIIA
jgi:hypothetical protein